MKRFLAVTLAIVTLALTDTIYAQAQPVNGQAGTEIWAGQYSSILPQFQISLNQKFSPHFGWSVFSTTDRTFSETYASLTCSPRPWITLSAGMGVERGYDHPRYAASLWMGKGKLSLLSVHEQGSGYFFRHILSYRLNKHFSAGVFAQRGKGVGPYLEYKADKFKIYTAVVKERGEKTKAILGMKFLF